MSPDIHGSCLPELRGLRRRLAQCAGRVPLLLGLCAPLLTAVCAEDPNPRVFGFRGPEVFPINDSISQLRAADLDGDGLLDLVVANNARSRITVLYNQTGQTNAPVATPERRLEVNELPPDARFRIESIASEKRIAALLLTDLNSDGRPDLAYYGEPRELVVQYNQGSNVWSAPKRWPIEDGQLSPNALGSGDLNGDGRTDLVLLGENVLSFLAQRPDHTLAEPERIPFSGAVKSAQVLDIDGNARADLLLVNWEDPNPFRFRLQNQAGELGPEIYFAMMPLRSYWADDLDADQRTEIITIAANSGRAQIGNFIQKPAELLAGDLHQGQFQLLPLNRSSKSRRGLLWSDVNGDQRSDLLVAEPDSGQLTLFLQQADGGISEGRTFPSLSGVTHIAAARETGEAAATVYVLSPDERQVGVTRLDPQGRLPFPAALPLEGRPLALAVEHASDANPARLALLLDRDGRRFLEIRQGETVVRTQPLAESFKGTPTDMKWLDADQDGRRDLLILIPYEKIKVLRQLPDQEYEELDVAPPGGSLEQPWVSLADVDGDGREELLLAQKNFLRAVVLAGQARGEDRNTWIFRVKDQVNGVASNSRIVAAAPVPGGTNAVPFLFLLDAERKVLTLTQRDTNGVWQIVRNIQLPITDFFELQPIALGATQPNSLAFLGLNAAAWMAFSGSTWEFNPLDGYETPIRDGRLNDVVSGDLNGDRRKDLVFLEMARNHLDLVIFNEHQRLVPATRWQVFEERSFRSRRGGEMEPREALVADVTHDGKNDLVVVVHDRILVYPQE